MAEPYERAEELRRLERAKTSEKILAPFRSMSKGDKDFGMRNELCDDRLPPQTLKRNIGHYSSLQHLKVFLPTSPRIKRPVNKEGFSPFPEHVPEMLTQDSAPMSLRASKYGPWYPTHNYQSRP